MCHCFSHVLTRLELLFRTYDTISVCITRGVNYELFLLDVERHDVVICALLAFSVPIVLNLVYPLFTSKQLYSPS